MLVPTIPLSLKGQSLVSGGFKSLLMIFLLNHKYSKEKKFNVVITLDRKVNAEWNNC